MTCPMTVDLGVYALGAADASERVLIESHLATCPECRAELALLEPLPGLLARVPVSLLAGDPPPRARPGPNPRGRARRRLAVLGAAAAAVAAGGFWLAQPTPSPPAAIILSAANPATRVRVTMTLTGTSWGTSIRLIARGLPLNEPCRLIVRSRTGGTEVTGAWDAWRAGPVSIPASAAWRPADIASLQVATPSRSLVTVMAGRPAPRPT